MEEPENEEIIAVIRAIEMFQLDKLDNEWVTNLFHSEFLDASELPSEYDALFDVNEIYKILKATGRALDFWRTQRSWASLSRQFKYRHLLALLYHLVDYGTRNVSTQEYRNNAVLAAQLYCKLLAVPGFKAYDVYHSQLFVACLSCLGYPKILCDSENNRLSAKERAREVNAYNTRLCSFLKDLKVVVKLLQLKVEEVAFEEILNHLIDLTEMAYNDKLNLDRLELNIISQLSYDIIHTLLVGGDNEPRPDCIQALFKCLLPKLVATSLDCRASASIARAAHVTYCGVLLARYGKAALFGYNILLQHLSYTQECMERSDVRTSRVSLVVGLMSLLPKKAYKKFVDWLLVLSTTSKAPHRLFALEIFAKLLNTNQDEEKPPEAQSSTSQEAPAVPSAVGGTTTLEGAAMNAQVTAPEQTTPPPSINEDSQSSQDSQESEQTEEDGAPVITAQTHSVPYGKILQATYERANDVSSTVRVRALAILMSCITSDQPALIRAVKKLSGQEQQLMSLAVRYMGDERAVVRRSAITLVDVQLRRDEALLTKNNLGVLVSLCRDTSMLVRSTAVVTLGELMIHWPRDCTFDAFLAGPMRQLKDPEPKVQELILERVKEVVLDRLAVHSAPREPHHHLPWMFLSAVARHNMRRHLEKVCAMLATTAKCINYRLIDIISTHLGTDAENDLNCMVLLSSVARHVEYSNVDFLLAYYYDLTNNLQCRDARLLPLLLEVLTDWSRYFTPEQRSTLRCHLIEGLHSGSCGSEGSRRACAMLAAHLDPTNVGWASEFLLACERRALEGAPVSEWVCAADMSLVAPEQPSAQLVDLFISTAAEFSNPRPELPAWSQGCVVAGLGRMCLRSRAAAAAAAPTLAALLVAPRAPICVRVNSLLALSDLCKRYTGIVEPQLGAMCSCLEAAPSPLRRAAVRALTRLLLDDYLRLRAPLYYRYCALLADPDVEVREPVEYYVSSVLTSEVIYHHFVDTLMYYNGCSGHSLPEAQGKVAEEDKESEEKNREMEEKDKESVAHGKESEEMSKDLKEKDKELQEDPMNDDQGLTPERSAHESRQLVYDLMLQRTTPGQRLGLQCRLAREVLGAADAAAAEGPLPPALAAAALDTLAVLRGPHMRLPSKPQTETVMNMEDLTARVTSNIVSHKMKKTVAEVLVPCVIRLYGSVAGAGAGAGAGQLATSLVQLASELLKDYRQEIEELIDNDPELVEQISLFQQRIGEEPSFKSRHNIVLQDVPDVEATPLMRRAARARRPPPTRPPPTKRALRL